MARTVAKAARMPRVDFSEGFTRGNNPVYVFGGLLTERQFSAGDFALNFLNTPPPLDNFRTQFSAGRRDAVRVAPIVAPTFRSAHAEGVARTTAFVARGFSAL